ncbi:MAG: hypothetical protein JST42_13940 [Bacteroidetes bacterium]|nr:hypothetical protein [Bacteroidota bacterium]
MGFSFGGILFKNGGRVKDEALLDLLHSNNYRYTGITSMEAAVSAEFRGVGIARTKELAILIGRNIPFRLSFENEEHLTETDKRLMTLSDEGDIIAVLSDSVSDTYCYSIFKQGRRIRVKKITGNRLAYESGKATGYDRNLGQGSNGMMDLIIGFTGLSYSELVFDLGLKVKVYNL